MRESNLSTNDGEKDKQQPWKHKWETRAFPAPHTQSSERASNKTGSGSERWGETKTKPLCTHTQKQMKTRTLSKPKKWLNILYSDCCPLYQWQLQHFSISLIKVLLKYPTIELGLFLVEGRLMVLQWCHYPNFQNLWICYIRWQEGIQVANPPA